MSQILHTEHLMLRPCTLADLDAVRELWTDPDLRWFLFDDRTLSGQEASDFLVASNESFAQQGYGLFFERGDAAEGQLSTIAGFSSLMSVSDQSPRRGIWYPTPALGPRLLYRINGGSLALRL